MRPDVIVVGAGPAGVSAALWARSLDLEPLVLESAPAPGGQLLHVHFALPNVAGLAAAHGAEVAERFAAQLAERRIAVRCDAVATALEPGTRERSPAVLLSTGERVEAATVLVASGARRRHLDVPGERELEGRGVSYSATRDRAELAGRRVAVAGGGDAAYENALLLAEAGSEVTLLVRGEPRARVEFRARVAGEPRIRVRENVRVLEVEGGTRVRAVRLAAPAREERIEVDALVIKVGVMPNSEWCRSVLAHDEDGFLIVDDHLATSAEGVWAAGDVARPPLASMTVAMAHGALAMAHIRGALRG